MKSSMLIIFLTTFLLLNSVQSQEDWLVTKITTPSQLLKIDADTIRLTNGLIYRDFLVSPNFVTIDFYSLEKQSSILRAISPESLIIIDGLYYRVGGVNTSIPRAYLNRTALALNMSVDHDAFHYVTHRTGPPVAPFKYRPRRGAPKDIVWPPTGLRLDVDFKAPYWAPYNHQQVTVTVHYEIYDGIPLISKWISITGLPSVTNQVQVFVASVEALAVNLQWGHNGYGWLFIENDMPHTITKWYVDSAGGSMPGSFEASVNCTYPSTTLVPLAGGFTSFRVHILAVGSSDPERFGLAVRRKMRLLAPHTQENPIFFHMINGSSVAMRSVVDQLADAGFEMMIYSFGSGINLESNNNKYLEQIKADIAYANGKGIEVGGYDLIVLSRKVQSYWMALGSNGACIASGWYDFLLSHFLSFVSETGLSMVETDGPYPGYFCNSTNHSHHTGRSDSVYWQLLLQSQFYKTLREKEIYINQPDQYFYQGANKGVLGYNEWQFSLPRWQDISISRQGMFDDTFRFTPTVGWMFMPLTNYHGGGTEAAFEPLSDHIVEYEWGLAQYLGAGVAACYRGYRLYDSNATRDIVIKWVSFYKRYRDILTSDIIHVRRADMQGVDSFMHVNPSLPIRGLVMVFNPTHQKAVVNLTLPLYYTGLTDVAVVAQEGGAGVKYNIDRHYNIILPIKMMPLNITWYLIE